MKIAFDLVDGSEAADLVKAWADENGMPPGVMAGLLFVAKVEKLPHGLREPGTVAKRVQERPQSERRPKRGWSNRRAAVRDGEVMARSTCLLHTVT